MKWVLCITFTIIQIITWAQTETKMLKGITANLTAKGGYYPMFFVRPLPGIEFQGVAAYSNHSPKLSYFDETNVQGWFVGGGIAFLDRPFWNKPQDTEKAVKGSFRVGFKFMAGRMQYDAYKVFSGNSFENYTYTDSQRKLNTDYGELTIGYEMIIHDRIKIDLIPIIIGDSGVYSKTGFTLPFSAIGGRTGFPLAAGVALSYLWR